MIRLPWDRHGHGTAPSDGGMEHLETDVMRFMAILAFCLLAIFALVQSIPLTPSIETDAVPEEIEQPVTFANKPPPGTIDRTEPEAGIAAPPKLRSMPTPRSKKEIPTPNVDRQAQSKKPNARVLTPAPTAPKPEPPTKSPEQASPDASEQQQGFSLQFESDEALVQLVKEKRVTLYAFAGSKVWQMMIVNGRPGFRPTQSPRRFHEMTSDTVPVDVIRTLRRLVTVSLSDLTWGVTLPASTITDLNRFVANNRGGALVIDATGILHMNGH